MQSAGHNGRLGSMRRELAALLAASLACVLVLLAGIASGGRSLFGVSLEQLPAIAVIGAVLLLGFVLFWMTAGKARHEARLARNESADLKRSLAAADSIIRSEPQILVF